MSDKTQQKRSPISEDWLAVIIAFVLILLSTIGLLGPNGLNIQF
jgi:hypothetical protein